MISERQRKLAMQYLDQLEDALIRIERNKAADWKDVQEAIRACYWLFREYLRQAEREAK